MVIAVVEDDAKDLEQITKMLNIILKNEDSLILFSDGIRLLNYIEDERGLCPFDLVLLDIKMPHINGVKVGSIIKEYAPGAAIVYVTDYKEYSLEAIATRPLAYLLKSDNFADELYQIIEEVRCQVNKQEIFFVRVRGKVVSLPLNGISYIESDGKKVRIHYSKEKYESYMKINDVESMLNNKGFIRIHRAYIVNMLHVVAVDRTNCILEIRGGTILHVSISKIRQVYDIFFEKRSLDE
ncbi:MAG: LytR/AlgR family response regulator transcription factor [Lachnospiraceae bacterium]